MAVWGATGQALVIHEFADQVGLRICALVDNDPDVQSILDVPLLRGIDGLRAWLSDNEAEQGFGAIIAIGGGRGADRLALADQMLALGLEPADAVHPHSYIAVDAELGPGLQVMAGAVIATRVRAGAQCLVNTAASVDHECVLGDGVHIGPGATLAGCVEVGDRTFVGAGATVLPNVSIGADTTIGAGSTVTRDVPGGATVVGTPARPLPRALE